MSLDWEVYADGDQRRAVLYRGNGRRERLWTSPACLIAQAPLW